MIRIERMLIITVLFFRAIIAESLTEEHAYSACWTVNCTNADSCPEGQYLEPRNDFSQCCSACRTYSQLKQHCNKQQKCAEGLVCVEKRKICEDPTKICVKEICPNLECPSGTYLVPGDGVNQCCDLCRKYAAKGESCDNGRQCLPGLQCDGLKLCSESQCSNVSCTADTTCDIWQYLLKADGVTICCDRCTNFTDDRAVCDDYSKHCGPHARCNENHICAVNYCAYGDCTNAYSCLDAEHLIERDGFNICCDLCYNYRQLGQTCERFDVCLPGLICNEKKECVEKNTCANGTYYVSHTGECIPYATYGQSCLRNVCVPEYFCNFAQKCTPYENIDCAIEHCASIESCAKDEYMVQPDGIAVCCQRCKKFAHENDYCDRHQKCQSPLVCNADNTCEKPAKECSKLHCGDILGCPDNQHLVTVENKLPCCSYCRDNSALGESCAADKPCLEGLFCNAGNVCEEIDCSDVTCHYRIRCPVGTYSLPGNGVTRCCEKCRPYAEIGEYCDATQLCQPRKLFCNQNNVCTKIY